MRVVSLILMPLAEENARSLSADDAERREGNNLSLNEFHWNTTNVTKFAFLTMSRTQQQPMRKLAFYWG